jgi:chromosome segregation ATPase
MRREKEELTEKLEEAHTEISSLNESRASLLEALEKTTKAKEILKTETEGALAMKDAEMNFLMRDYDEKLSRLDSERAKAESELRNAIEKATASEKKKAGEAISHLTDALFQKDGALSALEQRLEWTHERITSLEETISEKENANAELNANLASLRNDMDAFTREKEALLAKLRETESVRDTQQELLEKVGTLEENLKRESQRKAELQNALTSKDLKMEEFRAGHESENKRLDAEIERLNADAVRAAESMKDLEGKASLKDSRIAELEGQRSLFQEEVGRQKAEIESLSEMVNRTKEEFRHFTETAKSEKEALESSLSLTKSESETQVQTAEVLKANLSAARQHITHLEGVMSAKEISLREMREKVKEYEKLIEEKNALSGKLAEAMRESHVLREVKTFLSEEAKKLDEELKKIKEENAALSLTLKEEAQEAFAKILQSTGRLENTIHEGMHLAKKLEEISANTLKENLPSVLGRTSPHSHRGIRRPLKNAIFVVFLALVTVAAIAGVLLFKDDVYRALQPDRGEKKSLIPAEAKIWAEGIKQTRDSEYPITLVFLNKEAISVLGLSEKIPDTSLAENHYALLEIKAEGGCIPEGFVSSWTKNVAFLDASGTPLPINLPESISNERRVVYKAHACGEQPGVLYMRDIISIGKGFNVSGLTIRGLKKDSPIILR